MIRPTARMVLIFVAGIPLALFVVIYDPALWPLSFNYGVLVALATASDLMLALQPRGLAVRIATPDRLSIGERGAVIAQAKALVEFARRHGYRVDELVEIIETVA